MRDSAPDDVLAGTCGYGTTVASWRGATLLASGLVAVAGSAVWSRHRSIKDSITLEVARLDQGTDWLPDSDYLHPLAARGQVIAPVVTITSHLTKRVWHTPLGRFRISETIPTSRDTVRVTAVGIEGRMISQRIAQPMAPADGGTFASELRRLMPLGLSAWISPELVDRPCPTTMVFAETPYAAVKMLLDAWPAIARPDGNGQLVVEPPRPVTAVPTVTLSNGELTRANGLPIVVSAPMGSSSDDIYNEIIINGSKTDESSKPPFQKVVRQLTGPFAADAMGFGIVSREVSSAAIATEEQAQAVGEAMLAATLRGASTVRVEMEKDPRWEIDDAAGVRDGLNTVTGIWDTDVVGYVEGVELPLSHDGGAMVMDVAVTP